MTRPRLLDLFARTVRDGDCRLWTGWKNDCGYGYVRVNGRGTPVHRVVYEQAVGPIPAGHEIDHLCRQRSCVEPRHLEAVTHAENQLRIRANQTSCRRAGHDWTDPRNVYTRPNGRRYCAECSRQNQREARRANAA